MTKSRTLAFRDAAERALNAVALLRRLLGKDFPKGVKKMSRYRRLLASARAARKRKVWPKVRFVLAIAEVEAWDATSFSFLRKTPGEVILADLENVLGRYGQLEAALRVLSMRAMGMSLQFAGEAENPMFEVFRSLADLALEEENNASARRLEFLTIGQISAMARVRTGMPTRVGLTASAHRFERERLEVDMLKEGFSQSDIGMLVDGPSGTAAQRGKKVAQRHAGWHPAKGPRKRGTQRSRSAKKPGN